MTFPVLWVEPEVPILKQLYEQKMTENQRTYFECSLPRFRFVLDCARRTIHPQGKILDLGCSPGYIGISLHRLGYKVHGIDMNNLYDQHYPDPEWMRLLNVQKVNVEMETLRFPPHSFDGVIFTEILEHVAITNPDRILAQIWRILRPNGTFILTTPNVCNISHVMALLRGNNVFWRPELFYGSTDRHNREYTPNEVLDLLKRSRFHPIETFLFNSHNNWNSSTAESVYRILPRLSGKQHPSLGNTILVSAQPIHNYTPPT